MPAKPKSTKPEEQKPAVKTESAQNPLIMPLSELLKLDRKAQEAFRAAGGTSTEG
jgi:hypothetical protein